MNNEQTIKIGNAESFPCHLMDFFSSTFDTHKSAKEHFMFCFLQRWIDLCFVLLLETLLEVESKHEPLERGTVFSLYSPVLYSAFYVSQCCPFTNSILIMCPWNGWIPN
ncbi:hypothetical protein INR49_026389 [Caranx melampygus]|nr:hypothetical protein INR49_026389 [Caranx melampygus]